jgi:hypothetical protein
MSEPVSALGRRRMTSPKKASKFSRSWASEKLSRPMHAETVPPRSLRNCRAPRWRRATASATSSVTVPNLGFGIRPLQRCQTMVSAQLTSAHGDGCVCASLAVCDIQTERERSGCALL